MAIQRMLTTTTKKGKAKGLEITQRDTEMMRFIARWWCISTHHYIRHTRPKTEWEPWYESAETTPENEHKRWLAHLGIRRRISKLNNASEQYLSTARKERSEICTWLTPLGGELIDAPFKDYKAGNLSRTEHAFMACDTGMQLEALGMTIYSEREISTGVTIDGEEIWTQDTPLNPTPGSKSINKNHGKRPDLAAQTSTGHYIFIEAERRENGATSYYTNKLKSYMANQNVKAIWYVVTSETVAMRIYKAHQQLLKEYPNNTTLLGFIKADKLPSGYYKLNDSPGALFITQAQQLGAMPLK